MKKQKTIPTFFAIVILVASIAVGVYLIQNRTSFETNASVDVSPSQVKVTNLTDKSFTVSWSTSKKARGFISYGDTKSLGNVVAQKSSLPESLTQVHQVTVYDLKPNTSYLFKIGSNDQLFDNNGQLYQVKTASQIANLPQTDIIFGNLVDQSGGNVADALIYINLPGMSPQSAVTDFQGRWSLPLSTARSTDLLSYVVYTNDTPLEISVLANGIVTTVKVKVQDAHPVPTIVLGKNQDFTNVNSLPAGSLPKSQITLPSQTSVPQ